MITPITPLSLPPGGPSLLRPEWTCLHALRDPLYVVNICQALSHTQMLCEDAKKTKCMTTI